VRGNVVLEMPMDASTEASTDALETCMSRWFSGALTWKPEVALGISGTDPFLSADELTLHYSVNLLDIYVARRAAARSARPSPARRWWPISAPPPARAACRSTATGRSR
jgi:hypothetical protein